MNTHMNFDYLNSFSSNLIGKKVRRRSLHRRGRNVLIILAIIAYVLIIFFLEQVLKWLHFSEKMQREALIFVATSTPGFALLKLSELEVMMMSAVLKWKKP